MARQKKKLADLTAEEFPFRYETYSQIYDDLQMAARRFSVHGYADLAAEMEAVNARLYQAWNAVTEAERQGR